MFSPRFCVDNPLDNEQQDKVTIFRTFHSLLMSGSGQKKSESEDRDMQILENSDCRSTEETNIAQCVSPLKSEYKEDDEYQVDESLTYDSDIFKREISNQGMDNQIGMEENTGENQPAKERFSDQHQKSKHDGKRYKCTQCDYQTTHKGSLITHQKSIHEGIRYKCNQCDYQATQKSNLLRHQKSNHYVKEYN